VDFRAYAAQSDEQLDLLEGALLIASDARPGLDPSAIAAQLDELAEPLAPKALGRLPAAAQARALADQLFVHIGFHGNTADYYDPRNSFLDEVLARRTGIPITLSVVYVEVARRLGVRASPVSFPGHFLVCIDDERQRLVIDPFHGGRALGATTLGELLRRSGSNLAFTTELVAPTPVRQVVARMLMNLRAIYAMRGDYARLLVVFDRLLDLLPGSAEEFRDRGFLFARLGAPDAAVSDLRRYLELVPRAADADDVRRSVEKLEQAVKHGTPRS
jgi:regulator of sirC expression with transglutaminase-like and TPR domain